MLVFLTIFMGIGILSVLFWENGRILSEIERGVKIDEVEKRIEHLDILTFEYLLRRGKRTLRQWEEAYRYLNHYLPTIAVKNHKRKPI